ncbi:MAG: crossover junction endodeoxyribonuclease RuvC [Gammaproteobacteria bacterium RBG_16_66_13]|nr:MAG: crossover junction endodeoxyribonuclease RuvC [Gammaproteobacteria bacterium RBG_16_66_13]
MTAPAELVLGIDPGTARTGYGLVQHTASGGLRMVAYGVIETEAGQPMGERLLRLESELEALLAEHRPAGAGVERLYFDRNVSSALTVGQARGVVLLMLARHAIPMTEYTPREVKQAVVGYGGADKKQMQAMVRLLLEMDHEPRPDDAADALAIAICHAHASRTRQRLQEAG